MQDRRSIAHGAPIIRDFCIQLPQSSYVLPAYPGVNSTVLRLSGRELIWTKKTCLVRVLVKVLEIDYILVILVVNFKILYGKAWKIILFALRSEQHSHRSALCYLNNSCAFNRNWIMEIRVLWMRASARPFDRQPFVALEVMVSNVAVGLLSFRVLRTSLEVAKEALEMLHNTDSSSQRWKHKTKMEKVLSCIFQAPKWLTGAEEVEEGIKRLQRGEGVTREKVRSGGSRLLSLGTLCGSEGFSGFLSRWGRLRRSVT